MSAVIHMLKVVGASICDCSILQTQDFHVLACKIQLTTFWVLLIPTWTTSILYSSLGRFSLQTLHPQVEKNPSLKQKVYRDELCQWWLTHFGIDSLFWGDMLLCRMRNLGTKHGAKLSHLWHYARWKQLFKLHLTLDLCSLLWFSFAKMYGKTLQHFTYVF